jgi:uncharacterized protein (TIGR02996 family)
VEERALYGAILAAPHDDAARLVYADWLDEHAGDFPSPRAERARAEFIRLQCEFARLRPEGWRAPPRPFVPPLEGRCAPPRPFAPSPERERRLLFQHGQKWRRALPIAISSAPFDRGFLRPYRALRPQEFLGRVPLRDAISDRLLLTVPEASPARRYLPDGELFTTCPLWDVHLYATPFPWDPLRDHGQYAEQLAEVARSPRLARVGWLKVTFFATPVLDFLRTGNFANVETLVLNSGPFPEVLEAVAGNESFRSLRYVEFGFDREVWLRDYPTALRFTALHAKLRIANERHLPYGEMRAALRAILRDTPLVPAAVPTPAPAQTPAPAVTAQAGGRAPSNSFEAVRIILSMLVVLWFVVGSAIRIANNRGAPPPMPPEYKFHNTTDRYKIPPEAFDAAEKLIRKPKPPATREPGPEERRPGFVGPPRPRPAEPKE